jgi:uncharacterized membrane protein
MNTNRYDFLVFLRMILIWIGTISLIIALLFFVAYNWNELGSFFKFFIVETVLVSIVLLYLFSDKYKIAQKVLLTLSSITLGILLALIGQTYQTGADPWQLFAIWALLMTPWAFFASFSGLWILWVLLINLSAILYYQKFNLSISTFFNVNNDLSLLVFMLNSILWIIWSYLAKKYLSFRNKITIQFLSFFSLSSITFLAISSLYISTWHFFILYIIVLSVIYYTHRIKKLDMYIMSLYSLSIFLFSFNFSIKFFYTFMQKSPILMLLFILVTTIGLTMAAISWIKKLKGELT